MGKDQAERRLSPGRTSLGPVVGRRYQLLQRIGVGGMGVVFRARDLLSGQIVALKRVSLGRNAAAMGNGSTSLGSTAQRIPTAETDPTDAARQTTMPPDYAANTAMQTGIAIQRPEDASDAEAQRQALAQEFRSLSSLRHPNIISVLDYGFDEQQQPYITMELLEDANNVREFARGKPQSVRLELLRQILIALTYLHRREIIHRDLKPWNFPLLNLPKFLRGEFRGKAAQLIPNYFGSVNKKSSTELLGVGSKSVTSIVIFHSPSIIGFHAESQDTCVVV